MGRPQLFKVRRLLKVDDKEVFNWLVGFYANEMVWGSEPMDAYAFTDYKLAQQQCERAKNGKLRHPRAIYHTVVPA
jgi:hypothetical protein